MYQSIVVTTLLLRGGGIGFECCRKEETEGRDVMFEANI